MEDPVRTESQEEAEDAEDAEEEASVISLSCRYAVMSLCRYIVVSVGGGGATAIQFTDEGSMRR